MEAQQISIIIPTLNRYDSLNRTIKHIELSAHLPDEIIVIDQTPDIYLANQIYQLCNNSFLNIKYIKFERQTITGARNIGLSLASNEIIIFMDDDVDVRIDTLTNISDIFSNNKISMLGGLNENEKNRNSLLGILFYKHTFFKRHLGHVTPSMYGRFPIEIHSMTETEWAMGFFFAIRKSCLMKWNIKFDENLQYYAYAEDLDFTYTYYKKSHQEGKKCIMSNDVIVKHNVSQEYRTPSKKATYMFIIHREYLSYKHFKSPFYRFATRWANIGDYLYRIIYKQKASDIFKAQLFCDKYRKDIKQGIFHYDLFM
ncbi:glycosyltransferase family 2 protein [Bacteroides sp. 224]|uniref:glycosyltransferase family 2 protein n=1 Tax=Bacteroides sp. 224 TaxID=2302936 RepID=UPI0013D17B40|nr:glycosyltransferase [Bacteroides sp. 224]NDV66987.1 glycosyltransferase [Bacteroides sp. 224]